MWFPLFFLSSCKRQATKCLSKFHSHQKWRSSANDFEKWCRHDFHFTKVYPYDMTIGWKNFFYKRKTKPKEWQYWHSFSRISVGWAVVACRCVAISYVQLFRFYFSLRLWQWLVLSSILLDVKMTLALDCNSTWKWKIPISFVLFAFCAFFFTICATTF